MNYSFGVSLLERSGREESVISLPMGARREVLTGEIQQMKTLLRCGLLGLCLAFSSAHAVVVRIVDVSTGKLTGAAGVVVGGVLYDVEFLDGTCAAVFLGCDVAHFTFRSRDAAISASQALFDQVLLDVGTDLFDSDPTRTRGCENPSRCETLTSYRFALNEPDIVLGISAENASTCNMCGDVIHANGAHRDDDLSSDPSLVWARWSPHREDVCEPGALGLLAAGFLALVSTRMGGSCSH